MFKKFGSPNPYIDSDSNSDNETRVTSKRSDSSSVRSDVMTPQTNKKYPCYYYFNFANCNKGDFCKFSHDDRLKENLSKSICYFFLNGKCKIKKCRFSHGNIQQEKGPFKESKDNHKKKKDERERHKFKEYNHFNEAQVSEIVKRAVEDTLKNRGNRDRSMSNEKLNPYPFKNNYQSGRRVVEEEKTSKHYHHNKGRRERSRSSDHPSEYETHNFQKYPSKLNQNPSTKKKTLQKKDIKVLVLGTTGAGKSSLINLFYAWSQGWEAKDVFNNRMMIRTQYLDGDGETEKNVKSQGESQTMAAKVYNFDLVHEENGCKYSLCFLDTPGMGDTEGIHKDEENVDKILDEAVNQTENLNAILVVLNGSDPRINPRTKYTISKIQGMLPSAMSENLIFLLTNVALVPNLNVREALKEDIHPSRIFFYDNPIFKTDPNRIKDHNYARMLDQAFRGSMDSLSAMLDLISNCSVKSTQDFKKIREARDELKKKLVECNDAEARVYKKKLELQELARQITEGELTIQDLQQKLHFTVSEEVLQEIQTPYHNTTCLTCKNCCHERCSLSEMTNQGDVRFQGCVAFSHSPVCNQCKHDYTSHVHLRIIYQKSVYQVQQIDPNIQYAIQSAQMNFGSQRQVQDSIQFEMQKLDNELRSYHKEIQQIIKNMQKVCSRFDYIKEIEACLNVLEEQIEVATMNFSMSGTKNNALKVESLKETKKQMVKLQKDMVKYLNTN